MCRRRRPRQHLPSPHAKRRWPAEKKKLFFNHFFQFGFGFADLPIADAGHAGPVYAEGIVGVHDDDILEQHDVVAAQGVALLAEDQGPVPPAPPLLGVLGGMLAHGPGRGPVVRDHMTDEDIILIDRPGVFLLDQPDFLVKTNT
jgi:hypothetical protein